jgi:hypothetical protein
MLSPSLFVTEINLIFFLLFLILFSLRHLKLDHFVAHLASPTQKTYTSRQAFKRSKRDDPLGNITESPLNYKEKIVAPKQFTSAFVLSGILLHEERDTDETTVITVGTYDTLNSAFRP